MVIHFLFNKIVGSINLCVIIKSHCMKVLFGFLENNLLVKLFFLALLLCSFFTSSSYALAAELLLRPSEGLYELNQNIDLNVDIDPDSESFKSIEATLEFDPSMLVVTAIDVNESVIDEWTDKPEFSNTDGTITFSGQSERALLVRSNIMTVHFRVIGTGDTAITVAEISAVNNEDDSLDFSGPVASTSFSVVPVQPVIQELIKEIYVSPTLSNNIAQAMILNLVLLLVLLVFIAYIFHVRKQYRLHEERVKLETSEVREQMTKIFSALREEIYDQIRSITKRQKLSKKEQEAVDGLNRALEVSETLINKEIRDVQQLLD